LEYTLQEWLELDNQEIAAMVAQRASTAAVYLNGTRRWFLSRHKNWADYNRVISVEQRKLSQLFYDHGVQTMIQPVFGYDLLTRGDDYFKLGVKQGLAEMFTPDYRSWYRRNEVRITFYGDWEEVLFERKLSDLINAIREVIMETARYTQHKLLLGAFADGGLDNIVKLAQTVDRGDALLTAYYGQPVNQVDLIVGAGQLAIWDLPLLDINRASLYFLQAPTFCLDKETLRRILYDCIYERINDDELYDDLTPQTWENFKVLGIGKQTEKGWIAL